MPNKSKHSLAFCFMIPYFTVFPSFDPKEVFSATLRHSIRLNSWLAILLITSEMEELLGMCDRILVMYAGKIVGELQKNEFSQTKILELASGILD
jgi:ABC-type uncharacterized transport system ATPase component